MNRPTLATTLWLAAALLLLEPGGPSTAHACSCMRPTPEGSLQGASVVFEGQVLEASPVQTADGGQRMEVTLRVVRDYKNAGHERLKVWTAMHSAACGYTFEVGTSHLVYAAGDAEPYAVNLCSGTQPLPADEAFLALLGMGEVPVDPAPATASTQATKAEPPARGGCASCSVGARTGEAPLPGLAVLTLALAPLTFRRRS